MAKTTAELQEISWELIEEALTKGTMTLVHAPEKPIHLMPQDIVGIAKWLSTNKARKPQLVPTAEDFDLKKTTGGDTGADKKS